MKVALYARVSMDETNKDDKRYQEPENQLEPLRKWATALGFEITKEYTDRASGADPSRPQFRQMLNDAMTRQFQGILVWKIDRFSREGISNTFAYIQKLKERGIFLRSLTDSWLDTSQEGVTELIMAVMAWAAAEERRKISERTKAGIAQRRAIGQWKGGRPRTIPPILEVCEKRPDGYYCALCAENGLPPKRFKTESAYKQKWNAHRKTCHMKQLLVEKLIERQEEREKRGVPKTSEENKQR